MHVPEVVFDGLVVTNRACATSRFELRVAAMVATRSSVGVSEQTPLSA
jgi:hypothetical protein